MKVTKQLASFFGHLMAMFMGMFMGSHPSSHKERLIERMARHNAEAHAHMKESLQDYANKFLLPIGKYNRKTKQYDPDKKLSRYLEFIKERKEARLLKQGCKKYIIDGHVVFARNDKNAERKFANLRVGV